jgi:hypothetical protein
MAKMFVLLLAPVLAGLLLSAEKSDTVPLDQVILVTRAALDDYQGQAEKSAGTKDALPPLASADFDFKTVTDTKGGPSISLFLFTLGATKEKQVTNDLDFLYIPEANKTLATGRALGPKTLYESLLETLTAAARAVTQASGASGGDTDRRPLDFCQLTLTITFGVTTDVKGGITAPFQLVTLSGSLERSKNNVQQVKLTFKVKDENVKACAAKS